MWILKYMISVELQEKNGKWRQNKEIPIQVIDVGSNSFVVHFSHCPHKYLSILKYIEDWLNKKQYTLNMFHQLNNVTLWDPGSLLPGTITPPPPGQYPLCHLGNC